SIWRQNIDHRQLATLGDIAIEFVVRTREFAKDRPEFALDRVVRDHWTVFARNRPPNFFADKIDISFVFRMNGNAGVGHDCFRTRGRDFEKFSGLIDNLVADIIQIYALRFIDYFLVRQRGLRGRVPIDHSPAAVNEIFLVKIDKNFGDGASIRFVHRVALTRPIGRATEPLQLLDNDAAV